MDRLNTDIESKRELAKDPTIFESDDWLVFIPKIGKEINDATRETELKETVIHGDPCLKCKCTTYTTYQRQTRGVDEGMTFFNVCTNCGTVTQAL